MSPRRRGRRKSVPVSRQRSTRGQKYSRRQEARRPSASQEAKRKRAGRNGTAATKSSARFVPPPTAETLSWLAKVSNKDQRNAIGAGHRIKVRVDSESKEVKWRGGFITGVGSNGSKIRIKYNDGRSEVAMFPNKLIVVDEVGNGRHQIRDNVFSVPTAKQKPRRTDGVSAAREKATSKMNSRRPARKRKPTWKLRKDAASNDEESHSEKEEEEEEKTTRKENSTRKLRKDAASNEKESGSNEDEVEKSSRKRKRTRSLKKDAASNDKESASEEDEEETSPKRKGSRKLRKDAGSNDKESASEKEEEKEVEKAMSLKEQRKKVAVGQKVKVRFMRNVDRYGKSSRREEWYNGVISRVFSRGSRVRIDYEDGDSEVSNFPDKDIVLVDESTTPTVSGSIVNTNRSVGSDDESFTDRSAALPASEPPKRRTSPRSLSEQITEHQRNSIEKGQKVKVRLPAEYDRSGKMTTENEWHEGVVTRVLGFGSQIGVEYNDGDSDILDFPDENIIVYDEPNAKGEERTSESRGYQHTSRRRTRPTFFVASPWNDDDTEAEPSLRHRNLGARSTARRLSDRGGHVEADATRKPPPRTQSREKGPIKTGEKQESSSTQLAVEEQRRKIAVGHKMKVAFMTECERHGKPITVRRWYSGTVTKVLSGGTKIRIQYKDGKSELRDFPNEDIVVEVFSAGLEADATRKSPPQTQSRDNGPIETEEKEESSSMQLAVEEQRRKIAVGDKVKAAFMTECERQGKPITIRRWYSGTVTKVLSGGSKIRILYKDGESGIFDFPNEDIVVEVFSAVVQGDATRKSPPQTQSRDRGPVETEKEQESSSAQLAVEEQRKKIAVGHKVKVAFMTECERHGNPWTVRRWYSGTVTKVLSGGSKIRIQYTKDGKSEIRGFPNQDIVAAFSAGAEGDATRKSPPQIQSHDKGPIETEEKEESSSMQLAVEEQRRKIAVGDKVKAAFMTECERHGKPITIRRWYSGTVTKVMSGGSKIRIQYKDGKSKISDFPNEDIVVEVFSGGGDGQETPSRRWSFPDYIETNGKDQSAGDELSPTFASRRRYRPDFFFASPWNDGSLKAEEQNMSSSGDMSVEKQRTGISVGQKVKGLFITKCERHGKMVEIRRWYSGTVAKVMSGGSKIQVRYKDGDTRVYDFPHKDIMLQCGITLPRNGKNKQKRAGAPSQSQKTRSLSPSRRWSYPVTSSEKDEHNGANASLRSQLLKSASSSRRRTPPEFYFASPWNDEPSETEGKPDSSTGKLSVEEQRKKISVGQKVKGLFVTECQRSGRAVEIRRWYSGTITKVLSGGSKVRIQYRDGDAEVSNFPNENIVVEDETLSSDSSEGYDTASDRDHIESDVESKSMAAEVPSEDDEDANRKIAAASDERGANANETSRKSSGTEEDVDAVSDECGTSAAVDGDEAGESHVQDQQSLFEESRVEASLKQPSEPVPKASHTVELEEKEAPDQPNQTTYTLVQDSTSDVSSKQASSSPKEASAGKSDNPAKSETEKSTDRDQKSLTEVEKQSVAEGQKVKVRFATMSIRHGKEVKILRWYSAIVTRVLAGGAKIQIQYNDGSSEVLDFPDKDIMVAEEEAPDSVREHEDSKRSNAATVVNKVDNPEREESSVPLRKRKHRLSLLGDTSVSVGSLPSSPATSTIPASEKWLNMLERLKRYKEKYGHALVPQRYKDDKSLGGWVIAQRRAKKLKRLSAEQVEQLERIGFAWDASFKRGAKRNGHNSEPRSAPEEHVSSSPVATEPATCNEEPAEETNPEVFEEDTEMTNSFTPEEDETILSIVLGKRTNGSADVEIGKKMRLLANYSPGELYQRALELAQQTPTVGSVGHRVQTALDAKKDDEHVSKRGRRI